MSEYMILILIVYAAVMIGMTLHGAHRGFVRLIAEAVSLLVSVWTVLTVSSVLADWQEGDASGLWQGVLLLIATGVIYKILRWILSSIRFIAHLPIFSWLDKLLGVVTGFAEGFAILYLLEYLLRIYLLR